MVVVGMLAYAGTLSCRNRIKEVTDLRLGKEEEGEPVGETKRVEGCPVSLPQPVSSNNLLTCFTGAG